MNQIWSGSEASVALQMLPPSSDQVETWLVQKKFLPATLVGHSFGGRVATQISVSKPSKVSKLILIATGGIPDPKWWYPVMGKIPKKAIQMFSPYFKPLLTSRDYKNAGPLLPFFKKVVKEDLSSLFAKIKVPTLIIWGEEDQELPLKHGRRIHRLISRSKLKIFPGDHFLFKKEAKKIAQTIHKFIQNEKN